MGLLFLLDNTTDPDLLNTLLTTVESACFASIGSPSDPPPKILHPSIFRLITSKHTTDLSNRLTEGSLPPLTPSDLTPNDFSSTSITSLEAWMLQRAQQAQAEAEAQDSQSSEPLSRIDRLRRAASVARYYWALDGKDLAERTATVLGMRTRENEAGQYVVSEEERAIKIRIPWRDVWLVEANLSISNMGIEEFAAEVEYTDEGMRVPEDGWCTPLDLAGPS